MDNAFHHHLLENSTYLYFVGTLSYLGGYSAGHPEVVDFPLDYTPYFVRWRHMGNETRKHINSVWKMDGQACVEISFSSISGLVAEYIVAIDVTRGRFPADAFARHPIFVGAT